MTSEWQSTASAGADRSRDPRIQPTALNIRVGTYQVPNNGHTAQCTSRSRMGAGGTAHAMRKTCFAKQHFSHQCSHETRVPLADPVNRDAGFDQDSSGRALKRLELFSSGQTALKFA